MQLGHTRRQVLVSALYLQIHQVVAQAYYCGAKESERPAVATLIETQHLAHQELTLDALHLIPSTLDLIHTGGGRYVVVLKPNQPHLYRTGTLTDLFSVANYERVDAKTKQHGRVEQRRCRCFKMNASSAAVRWQKSGMCTLLCVVRSREISGLMSKEVSYYVSNHTPTNQAQADELFNAIRGHCRAAVAGRRGDTSQTGCQSVGRRLTDWQSSSKSSTR
ncbi:ISAs1 family transposase [Spirosoma pollinicola]|uniref:ISAs1 family transposase n=1 Tax=Spirosoma pollinicola TaxID=2057025 RepID=UPI001F0C902F|nr:ISAs1 family transposase [Spirosoma pollinicola]